MKTSEKAKTGKTRAQKRKKTAIICAGVIAAAILLGVLALLFKNGIIKLNTPSKKEYPVRGVDVSRYQGDIDWQLLAAQDISFAYVKATEGSGYVDPSFEYNYACATRTGLRIGAYHFFSFDSPGKTQAENFIKTVTAYDRMLPPAVDVEYYGQYSASSHPDASVVKAELGRLLELIYDHYGIRPVIYATQATYKTYIRGNFDDYDIWIRDKYFTPGGNIVNWRFWQYSDKGVLPGYSGFEKYIDLDVFRGSAEEFEMYGFPEK